MTVFEMSDLSIALDDGREVVSNVDLSIDQGELVALVGESGCGKTSVGMACLGFARRGSRISGGSIRLGDMELRGASADALREVRGRRVTYVPQDPGTALNPRMQLGRQFTHVLHGMEKAERRRVLHDALERVGLPSDPRFLRRYPHEISGGQQQRVLIAMAIAPEPDLIVLDEPTTGLDVTTQAKVLELVANVRRELGVTMLYVTHDQAVVATIADRVLVMYAGRLVEVGSTPALFSAPSHPYTQRLLRAVPRKGEHGLRLVGIPGGPPAVGQRPPGCGFAPRCEHVTDLCRTEPALVPGSAPDHLVRCHHWTELGAMPRVSGEALAERTSGGGTPLLEVSGLQVGYGKDHLVLDGVGFSIAGGETLGIVGQSGSGKSTLGRSVLGLLPRSGGTVRLDGQELAPHVSERTQEQRVAVQAVFQNPGGSLNPRHRLGDIVARPLATLPREERTPIEERTRELFDRVRLPWALHDRYPTEISGGEKQRVAIARALASNPRLLVCDEVTSALDVSVQAVIVELLRDLRDSLGLTLLFVSHDLALVRAIADDVLVLEQGVVRDYGPAQRVFEQSEDAYTRQLLDAVPEVPNFEVRAP